MRRPFPATGLAVVMVALAATGCGSSSAGRSSSTTPTAPAPATPTAPAPATPTTPAAPTPPDDPAGPRLSGRLTVTPTVGRPTSTERFTITLPATSPSPTASSAGHLRTDVELAVARLTPGRPAAGCVATRYAALSAGARVRTVSLGPARGGSPWCVGEFTARVQEIERPVCSAGQMCPQFIRLVGILGPVRFRIR